MTRRLRRFWFEFDLPPNEASVPGHIVLDGGPPSRFWLWRGCGATGWDEADCLGLIAGLIEPEPVPRVIRAVADVDVSTLAPDIRSDVGVVVWRGVWFPRGASAWSPKHAT